MYDLPEPKLLPVKLSRKRVKAWRQQFLLCYSMPRAFAYEKYGNVLLGRFEHPNRYFVWYQLSYWVREPEEYKSVPSHLLEYDQAHRFRAHNMRKK